jgi:hypothetical protein
MSCHSRCAVAAIVLSLVSYSLAAADQIVYSNISTPTTGSFTPDKFLSFGRYDPYDPIGDEITLGDGGRILKEFRVLLSSSESTVLDTVSLSLQANDGVIESMGGYPFGPGTELWSWTLQGVAVNGPTLVTFAVPDVIRVELPDTFTWTVSSAGSVAGVATCDPPTIGSSASYFWSYSLAEQDWFALGLPGQSGNFGAEVVVVPEPASLALMLGGVLAALKRHAGRKRTADI